MRDRHNEKYRQDFADASPVPLQPDEDIDHIDGDKTNSAPSNLRKLPHAVHSAVTNESGKRTTQRLRKALAADPAKKLY